MGSMVIKIFLMFVLITTISFPQINYSSLTLDNCIKIALEKNKQKELSQKQLKKSEALLKQANSSKMPQLDISVLAYVNDEDINFIQPPMKLEMPGLSFPGMSISLPPLNIPANEIKIADKTSLLSEATLTLPLYTGGRISSIIEQAKLGIEISNNDLLLTESEIKFNVKNTFYSVVLARNVLKIANDALERFEATFKLTESVFNAGSEKVTKLDYLKNKMTLEAFRGMNSSIEANYKTAVAAFKYYMGLDQSDDISIIEAPADYNMELAEKFLKSEEMTKNNLSMQKLENSLKLYEYKVDEANSGYYPTIALVGNFRRWDNSYKYANFTKENQNILTLGVGLKWSLFNGFRTEGKTEEMETELSQLKTQKNLLDEGLKLQKEKLINELVESKEKIISSKAAMLTAIENRELNLRAYQNEMVPVSDFIEAQLFEAILSAQYEDALFKQASTIFKLENLFGDLR